MTSPWNDRNLLIALNRQGSHVKQQALLQHALLLASPSSTLPQEPLWKGGILHRVKWTHEMLQMHLATDEPQLLHVKSAIQGTLRSCRAMRHLPQCANWISRLNTLAARQSYSANDCIIHSESEYEQFLREVIEYGWDHAPTLSASEVARYTYEIAARMVELNIAPDSIAEHITSLLRHSSSGAVYVPDALSKAMHSGTHRFLTILGISGVRSLTGPLPPNIRVVHDEKMKLADWGGGGSKAADFIRSIREIPLNISGFRAAPIRHTIVEVATPAHDHASAVKLASRAMSVVMDDYVAQHPSLQVAIFPIMAVQVAGKSKTFRVLDNRTRDVLDARPLLRNWPQSLRPALRLMHIIRNTSGPLTRSALCWVALESSGLEADVDYQALAKTLALHSLRQETIFSYRLMALNCGATLEEHKRLLQKSTLSSSQAKRLVGHANSAENPRSIMTKALKALLIAELHRREATGAKIAFEENLSLLQNLGVARVDRDNNRDRSILVDFPKWTAALSDADKLSTDGKIVAKLAKSSPPLVEVVLKSAKSLMKSNVNLRKYLVTTADVGNDLLRAMYASRNMNLHSGIDDISGAEIFDRTSVRMLDAIIEVFSSWYASPNQTMEAKDIIQQLDERFDELMQYLQAGADVSTLDIAQLTSPHWSPQP